MKNISLFRSGFWITYANFITRVFVFASQLILARLLSPSDFGIIAIVYVFWSLFTLFTQGTSGAFIIYKGIENPRYVNTSYTLSVLTGLFLCIGMAAFSPFIARFFDEPDLKWLLIVFSINLLLSSVTYAQVGILTRQMMYRRIADISLIVSITRLVFTVGSALLGFRYWSFVIGDITSWLVNCILTFHFSNYKYKLRVYGDVRKEVLAFWAGTMGSSIGQYINFNSDNFTVAKVLGTASLGYYNLAYQLTMAFSSFFNPIIDQLGMPIFSQLTDDKEQEKALLKVIEQTALITTPIYTVLFFLLNDHTISLIFGAKWIPIVSMIPALLVLAYFRVINLPLNAMLIAKGRPEISARVNLIIAPFAVLGFVLGARYLGVVGVSLAAAIVLGVIWTCYWWFEACRKLSWPIRQFFTVGFSPILLSIPWILASFILSPYLSCLAFLASYILGVRFFYPKPYAFYKEKFIVGVSKIPKLNSR